jgi:radical SAM protein with 4Fe4S-binding SPASM domain
LIDKATAKAIKDANFAYVGVSIDGIGEFNDRFRGMIGAYNMALEGIRNSRDAGVRTGLRLTLNKRTLPQLPAIFDLAEAENIPRVYISHLVYSGRGNKIKKDDLSHEETRKALDFIFEKAIEFHQKGLDKDVLTGNNDADGVYLYLKVKREDDAKAEKIYKLLKMRGGNSSGTAIGCIDNIGNVHADQFWSHYSFGNVKEKPFSQIWTDTKDPVMCGLKNKKESVRGRCGHCSYLDICGGNYRVRAEAIYGNVWAEDPACYLTEEEIGVYANAKCKMQNAKF